MTAKNIIGTLNRRNIITVQDSISIANFAPANGVYGNDVVDDSPMFEAAAAWSAVNNGAPVYVPPAPVRYRWSSEWVDYGYANFVGIGDVQIYVASTNELLTISGPYSTYKNLNFVSDGANANYLMRLDEGADNCVLNNLTLTNAGSFIRIFSNWNRLDHIKGAQMRGTLIRMDGTANNNNIYDFGGQNVQTGISFDSVNSGVGNGPNYNRLVRGKKYVVEADLTPYQQTQTGGALGHPIYNPVTGEEITTYGGDIVSMTLEAFSNTIEDIETVQSRDGSGTINGNYNTIRGFRSSNGLGSGLGLFGSYNNAYSIDAYNMAQGLSCYSAFGGYGSFNNVYGGYIRNCRRWGIVVSRVGIRQWVADGTYSSVAHYCACYDPVNFVWNTYHSQIGTDTFGPDNMTFTVDAEGQPITGSDGSGIPWTWVSQGTSLSPVGNSYYGIRSVDNGLVSEPSIGTVYAGIANWYNVNQSPNYRYGCPGVADGQIQDYVLPQQNAIQGRLPVFRRIVGAVEGILTTDGQPPGSQNQLVVGNVISGVLNGTLIVKDNDSQGYITWTFSATFRRPASASPPEFNGATSMTMGNGTGLSWLNAITPVLKIDSVNNAIQISFTCVTGRSVSARAEFFGMAFAEIPAILEGEAIEP